jgi:hypothetical protein
MAEQRQPLPGFVGPSYQTVSDRFNNQRTVNMYIETDQTGTAKDNNRAVLLGTPGILLNKDFETTYPMRQLYVPAGNLRTAQTDCMYAFVDNQVWMTLNGSVWQKCTGQLDTVVGYISVADNGIDLVAVDGQSGYYIPIGGTTITKIVSEHFYPADTIDFQDGYFICNRKGTPEFFTSDLYAVTWPELNLATKSSTSDAVVAVISDNKLLYVLGTQSIEVWSNTGRSFQTPFEQIQGQYISTGCESPYSIVQLASTILWLGRTRNGGGSVYIMEGQGAKEVTTKPVSLALQSYGDLSKSVAYGYQEEGHDFYVLNVPGAPTTWVYDLTENQWHERQSYTVPVEEPIPPPPVFGPEQFLGTLAVYEQSNYIALSATGTSALTVDWGDGVIENFASGATIQHQFDFTNPSLGTDRLTSHGYKTAEVSIKPQTGLLTAINLGIRPTGITVNFVKPWIEIGFAGTTFSSITFDITTDGGFDDSRLIEKVYSPNNTITNFFQFFRNFLSLEEVDLYTNSGTNFVEMFGGCTALKTVTLSSTSNGTNFNGMFGACTQLETAPTLDTSNGTDFSGMFSNCLSLTSVPVYNTANGLSFASMFFANRSLTSVPAINTIKGTNFTSMFDRCSALTTIPLLNTVAGTNFSTMFANCRSLTSVPLLNTSNGITFTGMFASNGFGGTTALTTVPLFDLRKAFTCVDMFLGAVSLTSVPAFSMPIASNLSTMFSGCTALETSAVAHAGNSLCASMYLNCTNLKSIAPMNTAGVTDFSSMFSGCASLVTIPLLNTTNATTLNSMFSGCSSLQTVPALNCGGPAIGNYNGMFSTCPSLSSIKATGFKFSFSVGACKLSAAALNELYTNLPVVVGQTITITTNPGTTADNPAIATGKGWAVVGT